MKSKSSTKGNSVIRNEIGIPQLRMLFIFDIVFISLAILCSIFLYFYKKPYILILTLMLVGLLLLTIYIWVLIENAGNGNLIARYYFIVRGGYFFFLLVYTLFLFIDILVFAHSFLEVYLIYLPFIFYLALLLYEIFAITVSLLISFKFTCLNCEDLKYHLVLSKEDLIVKLEKMSKIDHGFGKKGKQKANKDKQDKNLDINDSKANSLKAIRTDNLNTYNVRF